MHPSFYSRHPQSPRHDSWHEKLMPAGRIEPNLAPACRKGHSRVSEGAIEVPEPRPEQQSRNPISRKALRARNLAAVLYPFQSVSGASIKSLSHWRQHVSLSRILIPFLIFLYQRYGAPVWESILGDVRGAASVAIWRPGTTPLRWLKVRGQRSEVRKLSPTRPL